MKHSFNLLLNLLIVLKGLALASVVATAAPLPVVNSGFEDTSGSASFFNEFSFGAFLGWEIYDDPNGLIGNGTGNTFFVGTLTPSPDPANPGEFVNFPAGAPEGNRVALAFNRNGSEGQGEYGLEQTLVGTPLEANRRYTLQVEIGNIATGVAQSGQNFLLNGFPGYRVELLAGGQMIAQDDNTLAGSILDGDFETSSFSFETSVATPELGLDLGIRLINLNVEDPLFLNSDLEVDFDDVRLNVVPALDGDFNFDGSVDAADYTVWRDGQTEGGANDYLVWRDNYGTTLGGGASTAVPEPTSIIMLTLVTPLLLKRSR